MQTRRQKHSSVLDQNDGDSLQEVLKALLHHKHE